MLLKKKNIGRYVTICLIASLICLFFISFSDAKALLPSIPEASMFLDQIDRNNYIVNKQLHGSNLFKWDFSNTNQYIYSYLKKSIENDFSNIIGIESGKDTTKMISNANFLISSSGNHTADLELKDIETVITHWNGKEKKLQNIPSIVIASIDEEGMNKANKNNVDLLPEVLFPLPNRTLKVKENNTINKSIPVAINDKIFTVVGELIITLTDYVIINNRDCARFEVIADFENPNDLDGNCMCTIKTNTVYYFDIERHCLVAGGSAMLISIRYVDTATGQKIINDNHFFISLELECIEELMGQPGRP
ncbi:MAG: hypothetical protein PVH87_24990 [Desulfobacteraceae bacterium]|jgi:hypothetical protein